MENLENISWTSATSTKELDIAAGTLFAMQIQHPTRPAQCIRCADIILESDAHTFQIKNFYKDNRLFMMTIELQCLACAAEGGGTLERVIE